LEPRQSSTTVCGGTSGGVAAAHWDGMSLLAWRQRETLRAADWSFWGTAARHMAGPRPVAPAQSSSILPSRSLGAPSPTRRCRCFTAAAAQAADAFDAAWWQRDTRVGGDRSRSRPDSTPAWAQSAGDVSSASEQSVTLNMSCPRARGELARQTAGPDERVPWQSSTTARSSMSISHSFVFNRESSCGVGSSESEAGASSLRLASVSFRGFSRLPRRAMGRATDAQCPGAADAALRQRASFSDGESVNGAAWKHSAGAAEIAPWQSETRSSADSPPGAARAH